MGLSAASVLCGRLRSGGLCRSRLARTGPATQREAARKGEVGICEGRCASQVLQYERVANLASQSGTGEGRAQLPAAVRHASQLSPEREPRSRIRRYHYLSLGSTWEWRLVVPREGVSFRRCCTSVRNKRESLVSGFPVSPSEDPPQIARCHRGADSGRCDR